MKSIWNEVEERKYGVVGSFDLVARMLGCHVGYLVCNQRYGIHSFWRWDWFKLDKAILS